MLVSVIMASYRMLPDRRQEQEEIELSEKNDGLMWALVKEKPQEGLWLKRVLVPEVGPNDVKIKIRKTAICGTDVHIWQWNDWAQHTIPVGLTAGHEYVGEVVEVGNGVRGFKPGHLVSGEGHINCGKCRKDRKSTRLNSSHWS